MTMYTKSHLYSDLERIDITHMPMSTFLIQESLRTDRYILSKPRIEFHKTSLSFSGHSCCSSLPVAIKTIRAIEYFKKDLQKCRVTHLYPPEELFCPYG